MIVYSNGCSHTNGYCVKFHHTWPNIVMSSILSHTKYDTNPSKLESENILFNESLHGAGNDYILHTSIEKIQLLIDSNKKPDYVFIQWSGPNRRTYYTPTGERLFVNAYDNPELGVLFEPQGSTNTLHYIYLFQQFLKDNNINYLFFNYMALDDCITKSKLYSKIDFTKFLIFEKDKSYLLNGALDYFKNKGFTCDDAGHPSDLANFEISQLICDKIGYSLIDKKYFLNNKPVLI